MNKALYVKRMNKAVYVKWMNKPVYVKRMNKPVYVKWMNKSLGQVKEGWYEPNCAPVCQVAGQSDDYQNLQVCFILFTGYLLSWGSNTNCLCFALRSSLIKSPSDFQTFFSFTLLPGSSTLLQTPTFLGCPPSALSWIVSTLSLTRLHLPGTHTLSPANDCLDDIFATI